MVADIPPVDVMCRTSSRSVEKRLSWSPGQILAFKDHQIAVALDFPAQRLQPRRPVRHNVIELRVKRGDGGIGKIGGQLIVVINENDRHNRTRPHEFIADVEHLRHVGEVDRRKLHGRRAVLRADEVAVDAIAPVTDVPVAGHLGMAFAQPLVGEIWDHGFELLIAGRVGEAGDSKEAGVSPDDLVVGSRMTAIGNADPA